VDADKKTHKIRLAGIDAPKLGQASRKYLLKQVNQKTVCVDWHKRDRYKRLVGVIKYEGRDVNLDVVKAGYAWHYKKYQKEQTPPDRVLYAQAEIKARSEVIGLWSEPSPINPSD
jgi:endonuclease YncB( thermonuclease family)